MTRQSHRNSGVLRGLIEFIGKLNKSLKNNFLNSALFRGTSKTIQNKLAYMLKVCRRNIYAEIKQSQIVSVTLHSTVDVSNLLQQIVAFHYGLSGTVHELSLIHI